MPAINASTGSWNEKDTIIGQRLHIKSIDDCAQFAIDFSTLPALQPSMAGSRADRRSATSLSLQPMPSHPCPEHLPLSGFSFGSITYKAEIRVPRPLTAVMSAERNGMDTDGDYNICRFHMPQAIPSYLFALARRATSLSRTWENDRAFIRSRRLSNPPHGSSRTRKE